MLNVPYQKEMDSVHYFTLFFNFVQFMNKYYLEFGLENKDHRLFNKTRVIALALSKSPRKNISVIKQFAPYLMFALFKQRIIDVSTSSLGKLICKLLEKGIYQHNFAKVDMVFPNYQTIELQN